MRRLFPLLLLLACDGGDTDETDGPVDLDGDGWDELSDCDDEDPTAFPGNTEVCDGVDNDCDGEVDDAAVGTRTFYEDADEDGFGNENRRVFSCYPTGGYVLDASDCDDTDPLRRPGADEICDRLDNDCDGEIDEEPVDGEWWYPDKDRDGWGSDADRIKSCVAIGGHLPTGGDCDDARKTINPDGVEVCDDRDFDEDCDGLVDDEDDSATELIAWYVDGDGDGYGDRDTPIFQCEQPEGRIAQGQDCRDDLDTVNPLQTEICGNELDDNCDDHAVECGVAGILDGSQAYLVRDGRQAGGAMGLGFLGPGDIDGNGAPDLICAAPLWDKGLDNNTGQIYYFMNPGKGVLSIGDARYAITGPEKYARYGRAMALADDLTGDGQPEIVIGSPGGTTEHVYIEEAAAGPDGAVLSLEGPSTRAAFGESLVWTLDTNDDGVGDLWIGGPDDETGGLRAGAAWLASGALTGTRSVVDDGFGAVYGVNAGARCGVSVAAVDLDGDGLPSFLVGCPHERVYAGLVGVFEAAPTGSLDIEDADGTLTGIKTRSGAGASLAGVGDVNDDGYDDFMVGAPGAGGSAVGWKGAAYLWFGEIGGTESLSIADITFEGEVAEDAFGHSLVGGDLTDDNVPEVVIGAPRSGGDKRGRVYVFTEPTVGTLGVDDAMGVVDGQDAIDNFGIGVGISPDLTKSGGSNSLLVGAHNRDAVGEGSGSVYVFGGGVGF